MRSIMVIAESHLDADARDWLSGTPDPYKAELEGEGGFVHALPEPEPGRLPACFEAILAQARAEGCHYVFISAEADEHPTLPKFDE